MTNHRSQTGAVSDQANLTPTDGIASPFATEKFRALVTDRFDIEALAYLQSDKNLEVSTSASPIPTAEELRRVQGLVIRSRTKINAALLNQAPRLEVIVTATSGFDHIDLKLTAARKIVVMHTPDANAASAAELTWALVLACARRIPEAHRGIKSGDWNRDSLVGTQLSGKTYGIIGLGRIGMRVAKIARAFDMQVIAYDPYQEDTQFAAAHAQRMSYEELFKLSDVVSFHVPATNETQFMLNEANIEFLNRGVILINASRGSVIAEKALILALERGWLTALGLDVFEREPLPRHSPLMNYPNVVLTPHLGATTGGAFAQASHEAAEKMRVFAGSPLNARVSSDRLPPEADWFELGQRQAGFSKPK